MKMQLFPDLLVVKNFLSFDPSEPINISPALWQEVLSLIKNGCLNWCVKLWEFLVAPWQSVFILCVRCLCGWTEPALQQQGQPGSSSLPPAGEFAELLLVGDEFAGNEVEKREYGPWFHQRRSLSWFTRPCLCQSASFQDTSCMWKKLSVDKHSQCDVRGLGSRCPILWQCRVANLVQVLLRILFLDKRLLARSRKPWFVCYSQCGWLSQQYLPSPQSCQRFMISNVTRVSGDFHTLFGVEIPHPLPFCSGILFAGRALGGEEVMTLRASRWYQHLCK